MKNSFNINQEEKNRILNLHESATKNQYLIYEQVSDKDIAGQIYNASYGPGTDEDNFIAAIEKIGSLQQLINVDNLLKNGYGRLGLQGQINDEFNPQEAAERESLDRIKRKISSLGASMTYKLANNSVVINYTQTSQNTTGQPTVQTSPDNTQKFDCASKVPGAIYRDAQTTNQNGLTSYKIGDTIFYSDGFKYTPGTGGKLNYDCNDPLLTTGRVQASPEANKNTGAKSTKGTKGYTTSSDIIKKLQDEIVKYDPNYKPTGVLDKTTLDALNKLIS